MTTPTDSTAGDQLDRARDAAAELAALGERPTRRAIAERARVRASVAGQAAREWREQQAETHTEEMQTPAVVARALERVWPLAMQAAREQLSDEVKGWKAQIQLAEQDATDAATEAEQVRAERDEMEKELANVRKQLNKAQAEITEVKTTVAVLTERASNADKRADEAEARINAAEARADKAEARADRAEQRADKAATTSPAKPRRATRKRTTPAKQEQK